MRMLLCLMLLCSATASAQQVDEIIAKYCQATGGRDKWSTVKTMRLYGSIEMAPGLLAPVTIVNSNAPVRLSYFDFTMQGMKMISCMRGNEGWVYEPFEGKREVDPMSPDDVREQILNSDPQDLFINYATKGYTIDYLGMDDIEGVDVHKLRLMTHDGDMVYYYMDATSGYLLKRTIRMRFKDKEKQLSQVYSDYRKISCGLSIPHNIQILGDEGQEQGAPIIITKVEINPSISADILYRKLTDQ
jgi:hypothetical protein